MTDARPFGTINTPMLRGRALAICACLALALASAPWPAQAAAPKVPSTNVAWVPAAVDADVDRARIMRFCSL